MSLHAAGSLTDVLSPLQNTCGAQPGLLCRTVLNWTHSTYLASGADVLFAKPLRILLILLIAIIVRRAVNKAIRRVIANAIDGQLSRFSALRRHAPTRLWEAVEPQPEVRERRRQRAETVGTLLRSATTFLVFGVALVTILGELGINLTPIVASAGIVGVAVGFGAQNLVRDFLTGIFMILEDQYGVGDVIDVGPPTSSNPVSGTVEAVSLRITRLRDVNGVVWHVRNGEILRVGNMSLGWARAVVDVPVAPGTPIEEARRVLLAAAREVQADERFAADVLEDPEVWGVETFTKDALNVRVVARTAPMRQWAVARELRERIRDAFDRGELAEPAAAPAIAVAGEGAGAAGAGPGGPGAGAVGGPPSSPGTSSAGGRPTGPTGTSPAG
jgi:small-conductance mechanosensitive channel